MRTGTRMHLEASEFYSSGKALYFDAGFICFCKILPISQNSILVILYFAVYSLIKSR